MKIQIPFPYFSKIVTAALAFCFVFGYSASARKLYMTKGSDNGLYLNGTNFSYSPGDTFVLRASLNPFSYFSLEEFHGTASNPIVIINEGGQVQVERIAARHCTYMKFTGTGSADQYGFYLTLPNQTVTSPAFAINGRSAFIEVEHIDVNTHGYGFWVKEEGSCDVSLQYPNWWLDHITIHDNRLRNLVQEGIYAGSTAPNGDRPVTCNGVTTYPLPIRLSNIKIYNNIIDHTGRGGIQLCDAQQGSNEIYNNTVTNAGFEYVPSQGNGIVLGSYTTAYVHDNVIDYTYSTGIFSLGAGLIRIENNKVDHSGQLAGTSANGSASIMIDTRLTIPTINTQFYIKNNTLGSNTDGHVRLYNTFPTFVIDNLICNNYTNTGGAITIYANPGIYWGTCSGNQTPIANAGQNQTITLPANSATLSGSGTDADGNIVSYQWSQIYGPADASISNASAAQTSVNNLIQGTYTFRLKITDNGGASATADVSIIVSAASTSTTSASTPSIHIEAENYSSMYGIRVETTTDQGGGQDVGWQDDNDWMDYSVNVANAGTYTINFRVASLFGGAQVQLRKSDGTALTTITVPATGGYQTWQTVSASVTLPAGQQTLRIYTVRASGGWNLNWWDVVGASSNSTTTTTTTGTSSGSTSSTHIEAEDYSNQYGILTEPTSDAGGGKDVGYQDNNDWMDYSVNLSSSGTYNMNFRVASLFGGAQFQLKASDGTVLATVTVPSTGGYQSWQTVSASVTLPAGQQTLRIYTVNSGGGWNLNWWEIAGASSSSASNNTATSSSIHIEAENFSSQYGIQTESTLDQGGGLNVGWQDDNDWMDYSVNVSNAGTYTVNFRVASLFGGAQFQLRKADGTVLATVNVPNTGSFQTWQTVSATVTLPAGQQTLRIYTVKASGGWNLNWWDIVGASSNTSSTTSSSIHIEAEDYSNQYGILTEPTSDAGGGKDVGYQDNNDWMDYSVNLSSSGTYNMNFRVASLFGGAQFQLKASDGTVLATVTVPSTGGYQLWQTVSASVTLPAGQQTLRIYTVNSGGGWNLNWMDIMAQGSTTSTVKTAAVGDAVVSDSSSDAGMTLFPNPATDRFSIKVNNTIKGQMTVRIVNISGQQVKQFILAKQNVGAVQSYLSIGDLPKGEYIVTVQMKDWTKSEKMIKE